MAFRKYSNAPMPAMPPVHAPTSRTFKGVPDPSTPPGWVRTTQPPGPSAKDVMAVEKDKAEMSKIPSEIDRNKSEVAFHNASAAKMSQEEQEKKIKDAILFKTVMGHFGGNAKNEKDYAGILGSSATGYQDPAAAKLTEMGMAPADFAETVKKKAEAKSEFPDTERGLKHMSMFKPGDKDSQGNPIAGADIAKMALGKYKMDPEDPRIDDFVQNFDRPKDSGPSMWRTLANRGLSFAKQFITGNSDDKLPGEDLASSGTPDTRVNPPQPGEARVFKDPAPESSGLPSTQGVQEGSYLKANGQRTHQLVKGQWQPIQQ